MSTDKRCKHNSGKNPATCQYTSTPTENDCRVQCNAYEWCIAYSYKTTDQTCDLVTSTGGCSSGKTAMYSEHIAALTTQLKEGVINKRKYLPSRTKRGRTHNIKVNQRIYPKKKQRKKAIHHTNAYRTVHQHVIHIDIIRGGGR